MTELESLVRANFEPLQYILFFGLLILLGAMESLAARKARVGATAEKLNRRRWPANAALTALNIVILGTLPITGIVAADLAMAQGWGLFNQFEVDPFALLTIGILLRSLVSYATHFTFHKVPLFWRFHRVHHCDTRLDVSTTVRVHPLEFLTALAILLFAVVALGLSPLSLLLYELLDIVIVLFSHANISLPNRLDRALRLVIVTPAMHRLHHSSHQPETDSNYGATFSCWDRLFGTYRSIDASKLDGIRLGLTEFQDDRTSSLLWLLKLPFQAREAFRP